MLKGWSLIFYGTTQPIVKNDPISVALPSVTNYPSNVSQSKTPGGKGNRKQQQQQQQKVAPFIILTPPRKGGKTNSKNTSGKNGKQKQQQTQTTTTRAPATTLYFNNGRKYEFINGVMSVNRPNGGNGANVSGQSSTIVATQTLKVLNNNVDSTKGDKLPYAKVPIKAPKQVKAAVKNGETAAEIGNVAGTTELPLDVEFVDSFQFTSNPNIPKLFQQYEKIQEFYPEFHPYVGVAAKSPTRLPSSSNGSKPSRDGSKNYMNSPAMDASHSHDDGVHHQQQQQQQQHINYAIDVDRGDAENANQQRYLFRDFALSPSPPASATSKLLSTALLSTATKKASPQTSGVAGTIKTGKG